MPSASMWAGHVLVDGDGRGARFADGIAVSNSSGAHGAMRLDSGKTLGLDHADMGRQMTPYIVRQGDYLLKLAHVFGFDPDEIWNHPKNDEIRSLRKDHNILAPGDVIYLPERQREGLPIVKGALNRYQATVPKTYVNLRFQSEDEPLAGAHFFVRGGATPAEGTSDEEGRVKLMVPIQVSEIDVSFPERGISYRCTPSVRFVEYVPQGEGDGPREPPHFVVHAHYTDADAMRNVCGGSMGSRSCVKQDQVAVTADDIKSYGGRHEAGHMLGLDDEYWEGPSQPGPPAAHSSLVLAEFGHEILRGQPQPDSIMGGTNLASPRILPEHGVVFLEALRKVTRVSEWYFFSGPSP